MEINDRQPIPECSSHFVEPPAWCPGEGEGKLACPKCAARVGSYAWHGTPCSCGTWVVPAFQLTKSRVDEREPR
jgi:dual specificity phosphatase 12